MNIVIIEDEAAAAARLKKMLAEISTDIKIIEMLDSIESAVDWLKAHSAPDLLLMDIHLADGPSFEIFKEIDIEVPVIFITAYDKYAIQAFKVNSIDYLLKPVKQEELAAALQKFQKISLQPQNYKHLLQAIQHEKKEYTKRLLIKFGQTIKAVEIDDIAYFFTEEKVVFLNTFDNRKYPVDYNLEQLENQILNNAKFFRINRQYIINIQAIKSMHTQSKGRVKIDLEPAALHETIVSTERSAEFKQWLVGEKSV